MYLLNRKTIYQATLKYLKQGYKVLGIKIKQRMMYIGTCDIWNDILYREKCFIIEGNIIKVIGKKFITEFF